MEAKQIVTPAIVGVVSFAAGVAAGYFFKRYQDDRPSVENLRAEVADQILITEEVASDLAQLQFMFEERDRKNDVTLQQAMKVIAAIQDKGSEFLANLKHDSEAHEFAVEEPGEQWSPDEDDEWNYKEELESRDSEHPYIIHRDEFFNKESQYDQSTLTYYKGDNILCDDLDVPVYQPEKVVGPLKFGHGSLDPSIVYIRNDELMGEYEVLLEYGTFEEVILEQKVSKDLGVRDLKHSLMKFRDE